MFDNDQRGIWKNISLLTCRRGALGRPSSDAYTGYGVRTARDRVQSGYNVSFQSGFRGIIRGHEMTSRLQLLLSK